MRKKIFSSSFIILFAIALSFLLSGCYTQVSRPTVDTDYYIDDEDEYISEYDEENSDEYVEIDNIVYEYDNIYYNPGVPVYYGPDVWGQWSPYYRFHHPHRRYPFDPWLRYSPYSGSMIVVLDPFWDPWFDDWYYYNSIYYYHPSRYYWGGHGHHVWKPTPKNRVKRTFNRRESHLVKQRIKKKPATSSIPTNKRIRRKSIHDVDQRISKQTSSGGKKTLRKPVTRRKIERPSIKRRTPSRKKEAKDISGKKIQKKATPGSKSKVQRRAPASGSKSRVYRPATPRTKQSPAPSKSSGTKGTTKSRGSKKGSKK